VARGLQGARPATGVTGRRPPCGAATRGLRSRATVLWGWLGGGEGWAWYEPPPWETSRRVWESVGECGRVWESVGECGRVWERVRECARVWESEHFEKVCTHDHPTTRTVVLITLHLPRSAPRGFASPTAASCADRVLSRGTAGAASATASESCLPSPPGIACTCRSQTPSCARLA